MGRGCCRAPAHGCTHRGLWGVVPRTACAFFFTFVDLEDGFHEMRLAEESQPPTAFITPFGTYMRTILPMGAKMGPQVF